MLQILDTYALARPNTAAVSNEQSAFSFGELASAVRAVIRFLGPESSPQTVYLALPSGPEFTALQLGTIEAGSVAVPLPHKLTPSEAQRFFSILKPDVLCVGSVEESREIVESLDDSTRVVVLKTAASGAPSKPVFTWKEIVDGNARLDGGKSQNSPVPSGVAMVQFTSGSTGWPKAILLKKAQILASQKLSSAHLAQFDQKPVFIPVPQFHAMGNALVIEHLLAGSPTHLANSQLFGDHLRRLVSLEAKAIQASPNYFRLLLRMDSFTPDLLPNLRFATIGSDWIDEALISELRSRFSRLAIFCRYGLSEAFGALGYNSVAPGANSAFDSGGLTLLEGVSVPDDLASATREAPASLRVGSPSAASHQLLHTGELVSLLDTDGLLNTGDLVFYNDNRKLIIAGRESQFIKFNGHRVSPYEIEDVLRKAPGVVEAFATGVPDPTTGQRIAACIVPLDGNLPSTNDLRKHCARHLSPYKVPHHFLFDIVPPKTPSGKIARGLLNQQVAKLVEAL